MVGFLKITIKKMIGSNIISAYIYVGGVITILDKTENLSHEIIGHLLNLKKKNLFIFVDDFIMGDLFILDLIIHNDKYKFEMSIFDMEVYTLTISSQNSKIHFRSVKKLWPGKLVDKLDVFTTTFLKKFRDDGWVLGLVTTKDVNIDLTSVRDVLILSEVVSTLSNIYRVYGLNVIKNKIVSLPSFAHKCFFKNFNFCKIEKFVSENVDCFVRGAYYGGRCEVFANPLDGGGEIIYYDFIGMYAQCMGELFPVGDGSFIFNDVDITQPGFFDITFHSTNMAIPTLPFKEWVGGKLTFPNGEMRGTY
jgi:hypothetical protein